MKKTSKKTPSSTPPAPPFRVWDKVARHFVKTDEAVDRSPEWVVSLSSGKIFHLKYSGDCCLISPPKSQKRYVLSQTTGLSDGAGTTVYEGDIVEFIYQVGDLAWQEMDETEREFQEKLVGRKFTGRVAREFTGTNMRLEVAFDSGIALFPIAYVSLPASRVIGHHFSGQTMLPTH